MNVRTTDMSCEGGSGGLLQHDAPALLPPAAEADEPARPSRMTWMLAALGAVVIHAGCMALALSYLKPEDVSDDLGAPAIAIGIELAAPHQDPVDLPPGPDSELVQPSPEIMEQKTEVERTELPKAAPTETDDPDRLVAPQEPKKPEDDQPKTPTVQTAPSEAEAASEATATPSPENAKEAPRSTAPDPGTGESLRRALTTWEKELAVHLEKYKRYPENRPPQRADGVIRLVLDRTGRVVSAEIAKSSGDAAFDAAALAMMKRADPVPAPPPLVADQSLAFTLPFNFTPPHRKGH